MCLLGMERLTCHFLVRKVVCNNSKLAPVQKRTCARDATPLEKCVFAEVKRGDGGSHSRESVSLDRVISCALVAVFLTIESKLTQGEGLPKSRETGWFSQLGIGIASFVRRETVPYLSVRRATDRNVPRQLHTWRKMSRLFAGI